MVTDHAEAKSRRQLGEVVFESTRAIERFYASPNVPRDAAVGKRSVMAHMYFQCAAAAVLWRKSIAQAIPMVCAGGYAGPTRVAAYPAHARRPGALRDGHASVHLTPPRISCQQ